MTTHKNRGVAQNEPWIMRSTKATHALSRSTWCNGSVTSKGSMCCPIGFGAISGSDPKDRKFDEVSYSLGSCHFHAMQSTKPGGRLKVWQIGRYFKLLSFKQAL